MTSAEMIEGAFATFEVASNATLLSEGIEIGVATCDQFVGIGLVAHIPNQSVTIEIKGLLQRKCELNDTKTRAQVTTAVGHHFQVSLPDLGSDIFELGHR